MVLFFWYKVFLKLSLYKNAKMFIEWKFSDHPAVLTANAGDLDSLSTLVEYTYALNFMQNHVKDMAKKPLPSCVWFLQHPSVYTAGTSTHARDILEPLPFPLYTVGRGGHITYHGPGQLVVYVMLNLKHWKCDIHWYIYSLEQWLMNSLKTWGISGYRKLGYPGIWVKPPGLMVESKIAAIGVRIQQWVTWHGFSLNVAPNLDHYKPIIPCGISQHGVTSLQDCGLSLKISEVANVLQHHFINVFSI